MNRYRDAKDYMEQIAPRKRVCNFGLVRCECAAAMECPAKREVVRLEAMIPSKENCGREDRCEWKQTSIEGHLAMKDALTAKTEEAAALLTHLQGLEAELTAAKALFRRARDEWDLHRFINTSTVEEIIAAGRGEGMK